MNRPAILLVLLLCSCTALVERRDLPVLDHTEYVKQIRSKVLTELLYHVKLKPARSVDRVEVLVFDGNFTDSMYCKVRLTCYSRIGEPIRWWQVLEGYVARWDPFMQRWKIEEAH